METEKLEINEELLPIVRQLLNEGYRLYTFLNYLRKPSNCFFWFENGRVLNIQPSWHGLDLYHLGVSYVPGRGVGTGCGILPTDDPIPAAELLQYRQNRTWVRDAVEYASMEHFLKRHSEYFEITLDKI